MLEVESKKIKQNLSKTQTELDLTQVSNTWRKEE